MGNAQGKSLNAASNQVNAELESMMTTACHLASVFVLKRQQWHAQPIYEGSETLSPHEGKSSISHGVDDDNSVPLLTVA